MAQGRQQDKATKGGSLKPAAAGSGKLECSAAGNVNREATREARTKALKRKWDSAIHQCKNIAELLSQKRAKTDAAVAPAVAEEPHAIAANGKGRGLWGPSACDTAMAEPGLGQLHRNCPVPAEQQASKPANCFIPTAIKMASNFLRVEHQASQPANCFIPTMASNFLRDSSKPGEVRARVEEHRQCHAEAEAAARVSNGYGSSEPCDEFFFDLDLQDSTEALLSVDLRDGANTRANRSWAPCRFAEAFTPPTCALQHHGLAGGAANDDAAADDSASAPEHQGPAESPGTPEVVCERKALHSLSTSACQAAQEAQPHLQHTSAARCNSGSLLCSSRVALDAHVDRDSLSTAASPSGMREVRMDEAAASTRADGEAGMTASVHSNPQMSAGVPLGSQMLAAVKQGQAAAGPNQLAEPNSRGEGTGPYLPMDLSYLAANHGQCVRWPFLEAAALNGQLEIYAEPEPSCGSVGEIELGGSDACSMNVDLQEGCTLPTTEKPANRKTVAECLADRVFAQHDEEKAWKIMGAFHEAHQALLICVNESTRNHVLRFWAGLVQPAVEKWLKEGQGQVPQGRPGDYEDEDMEDCEDDATSEWRALPEHLAAPQPEVFSYQDLAALRDALPVWDSNVSCLEPQLQQQFFEEAVDFSLFYGKCLAEVAGVAHEDASRAAPGGGTNDAYMNFREKIVAAHMSQEDGEFHGLQQWLRDNYSLWGVLVNKHRSS